MTVNRKLLSVSLWTIAVLHIANPSFAKPVSWNQLSAIQQDVLETHESRWHSYSEEYQHQLLQAIQQEVKRKTAYKEWVKTKLPADVRENMFRYKEIMSEAEFKRYIDELMLKYGRPQ